MKTTAKILILTATLMTTGAAVASDLTGGYLNSESREAALSLQDGNLRIHIRTTASKFYWGDAEYGSGKLFIIDARGNIQAARRDIRDNANHIVALPVGSDDKVVILNRYGNIVTAIGLDDAEILRFVPRDQQAQVQVIVEAQKRPVFAALRYSSHVLREMHADADSVADMLLTSIRWMAGSDVAQFVRLLMLKSGSNFLKGVSLVAQGGDGSGGTGRVAQGGDGSSGTGLVAQGGDGSGGTGLVAQGGDGSGGTGRVADLKIEVGLAGMAKVPAINGLSAVAKGKIVILQ